MRTLFDISPLHRSSVGFDRVFDLLESAARAQAPDNYPPFDSVKLDEDHYRITMAVAGFGHADLSITLEGNLLLISGDHRGEASGEFLHRGIAIRSFQRRFELAEHMKVVGARLADGLLAIDLQREVPEEMKPQRITIDVTGAAETSVRQLLDNVAA